jgi:hypothetical protein
MNALCVWILIWMMLGGIPQPPPSGRITPLPPPAGRGVTLPQPPGGRCGIPIPPASGRAISQPPPMGRAGTPLQPPGGRMAAPDHLPAGCRLVDEGAGEGFRGMDAL